MTRADMLARMSSTELSGWWAVWQVQADEAEDRADQASEPDGILKRAPRDYERPDHADTEE